jgi:tetratricopeptide (TPR) repeat protein
VQVVLRQAQIAITEDEQLALYNRVLELEKDQPEALIGKQQIWVKRGDKAFKVGKLKEALYAYEQAGDLEKIQRIKEIIVNDLDGVYNQALVALQGGQHQAAQRMLARVVITEPEYKEATRYLHLAVTGVDVTETQAKLSRSNFFP